MIAGKNQEEAKISSAVSMGVLALSLNLSDLRLVPLVVYFAIRQVQKSAFKCWERNSR